MLEPSLLKSEIPDPTYRLNQQPKVETSNDVNDDRIAVIIVFALLSHDISNIRLNHSPLQRPKYCGVSCCEIYETGTTVGAQTINGEIGSPLTVRLNHRQQASRLRDTTEMCGPAELLDQPTQSVVRENTLMKAIPDMETTSI